MANDWLYSSLKTCCINFKIEASRFSRRRTHRLRLNAEGKKKLPSCKPNLSGIVLLVDKDDNHCCATNSSPKGKRLTASDSSNSLPSPLFCWHTLTATCMMVTNPLDYVEPLRKASASGFTFHIETSKGCYSLYPCFFVKRIKSGGMMPGVALRLGTPVEEIYPLV
ncbi:hypothetical protein K1719_020888 [Acacia pycnantha]|nr:hypothetical protein K1719_020888 [Acacia pycnantha]